jgi:cell division septation protein DedD
MMATRNKIAAFLLAMLLSALFFTMVRAEDRNALVIGNGDYVKGIPPLVNPVNDAQSMTRALTKLGFHVTSRINASRSDMRAAVREFEDRLGHGGVGLFFYAGHGLQIDGENYLVPIDADVKRKYDVNDQCLKVSYILGAMEEAQNRLNIIILDACRNNPFRSFRGGSGGLARMDAPTGSLLAYATAPGSVAQDGIGQNGLYTSKLLLHMNDPDLEILDMFRKVRVDVMAESENLQVPWESTSLTGEFYFKASDETASLSQKPQTRPLPPTPKPSPPEPAAVDTILPIRGGYSVQVTAYTNQIAAEKDRDTLKSHGLPAFVEKVQEPNRVFYRLLVAIFQSADEAANYAAQLEQQGILKIIGVEHSPVVRQLDTPVLRPEPTSPEGAVYQVVHVENWDVLYMRNGPDPNTAKIGSIPYNARNIEFLGQTARYKKSTWYKVRYESLVGWVNAHYLQRIN